MEPQTTIEKHHNTKTEDNRSHFSKYWLNYWFILLEAVVIILYATLFDFSDLGKATKADPAGVALAQAHEVIAYPLFQDINVMMFVGFGFLMTFLRSHSWSSVGMTYVVTVWIIQISILCQGFWYCVFTNNWKSKVQVDIYTMTHADFAAASVLISVGAVLGKLTFLQYLVMSTIQTVFYTFCLVIGVKSFYAVDIGGAIFIHLFGAIFGLTVSLVIRKNSHYGHPENTSSYNSNIFSTIGTFFLWIYWPSFNGGISLGNAQVRCLINTYLSLTGSTLMVFLISPFFKDGKLHMEDVLNATLAGGVIVGASCDLNVNLWSSILIGCGAGTISLLGFEFINPWIQKTLGLYDTCGILYLHCIPGFLGGILSAIYSGVATKEIYGPDFAYLFPEIAKNARSASVQAGYQLAGIALVIGVGIFTGIITGLILNSMRSLPSLYNDADIWHMEESHDTEAVQLVKATEKAIRGFVEMKTSANEFGKIEMVSPHEK